MKKGEQPLELAHEAVPGYRTVFYIIVSVATLYLAVILFKTI